MYTAPSQKRCDLRHWAQTRLEFQATIMIRLLSQPLQHRGVQLFWSKLLSEPNVAAAAITMDIREYPAAS